jgi:competence protein ComEA
MDNKQRKYVFLGVLLLGCVATAWWQQEAPQSELTQAEPASVSSVEVKRREVMLQVYVSGAVLRPGIYELASGARALEAVEVAGGWREDADRDRVNLAKKLRDGAHVYVPMVKGKSAKVSSFAAVASDAGGKAAAKMQEAVLVELNEATGEELTRVPGIGPSLANRILALRRVRRFSKVDELLQVRGIGKSKLEQLRPYVYVR